MLVVFALTAVLGANSIYLLTLTVLEWLRGVLYENYFFQFMFLAHLGLGLALVLPFLVFCVVHIRSGRCHPNRRAIRVGYGLFALSLVLLGSGVVLMRVEGFEIKDPRLRSIAYWAHVITPALVLWVYLLHRLVGPKIRPQ